MKKIVITGGASGIGNQIKIDLLKNGFFVFSLDLKKQKKIKNVQNFICDISNFEELKKISTKTGKIFGLINNAGILFSKTLKNSEIDLIRKVIEINLIGTIFTTKAFEDKIEEGGRIVNISSIAAIYGQFGLSIYAASKAGIIGFSKSIAKELSARNICVNTIAPGIINTDMIKNEDKDAMKKICKNIPLNRLGTTKEISSLVLFLLSKESAYITRSLITVDGGLTF